jgi:hypothetical protein
MGPEQSMSTGTSLPAMRAAPAGTPPDSTSSVAACDESSTLPTSEATSPMCPKIALFGAQSSVSVLPNCETIPRERRRRSEPLHNLDRRSRSRFSATSPSEVDLGGQPFPLTPAPLTHQPQPGMITRVLMLSRYNCRNGGTVCPLRTQTPPDGVPCKEILTRYSRQQPGQTVSRPGRALWPAVAPCIAGPNTAPPAPTGVTPGAAYGPEGTVYASVSGLIRSSLSRSASVTRVPFRWAAP